MAKGALFALDVSLVLKSLFQKHKLLICTLQETLQASGKHRQQGKGPRSLIPGGKAPPPPCGRAQPQGGGHTQGSPRRPPGRYLPVLPVAEYPVSVGRVDLHRGIVDHLDAALLVRAAQRPHPAVHLGKERGWGGWGEHRPSEPPRRTAAGRAPGAPSPSGPPPPQPGPAAPHSPPRDPSGWRWAASSAPAFAASWPYWEKEGGVRGGPAGPDRGEPGPSRAPPAGGG